MQSSEQNDWAPVDAGNWAESITYFDGLGRAYKSEEINSNGNVFTEKEFDPDGRVLRVPNPYRAGETRKWTTNVYDGGGTLVAEYTAWATADPAPAAQVSYLTADHLGSPRVVTNQNGEVIKRTDWMAFGEEVEFNKRASGLGYDEVPETRKGYTGYEKDDESGLDFAQARYYNPKHGRFTSVDPLTASANVRNPQTFNRYTYVLNSPYKFTDPLGLIYLSNGKSIIWLHDKTYEDNRKEIEKLGYTTVVPEGTRVNVAEGATGIFKPYVGAEVILGPNGNLTAVMPEGVSPVQSEGYEDEPIQTMLDGTEEVLQYWRTPVYIAAVPVALPAIPILGGGSAAGGGVLGLGVSGGGLISPAAATPAIAEGVTQVLSNANNFGHIFASKHLLGPLLARFASPAALVTGVLNQIAPRLPVNGPFTETVVIEGFRVAVTGAVVNGVPLVSNMWIQMGPIP